jgi:hypothetical protein
MKSRMVWLGLGAFVLALIYVLPARWIAGFLPSQVQCAAWSGSVWRGQCAGVTVLQPDSTKLPIELLRWKLHPGALLRLSVRASFDVRTSQGTGSGQFELGRKGRMTLQNVSATAIFDNRLATMLARGWTGRLEAQDLTVSLQGNQLLALSGDLTLRDFNDGRGGALGSYRLRFPATASPPFVGALQDTGGPLAVTASLTIAADRHWLLDGQVTPRPDASAALLRSLDYIGAPDASGRRHLAVEGSFK